jgi:hypothetical protein
MVGPGVVGTVGGGVGPGVVGAGVVGAVVVAVVSEVEGVVLVVVSVVGGRCGRPGVHVAVGRLVVGSTEGERRHHADEQHHRHGDTDEHALLGAAC